MKRKYNLKYLFEVEYADGSTYKQNQEDHSVYFPPVKDEDGNYQGKSCMTDVLEDVKNGKKIRRFSLVNKHNRVTVDLGNGIFYINRLPVLLESDQLPTLPDKFELLYYRQVDQSANVTFKTDTKEITKIEPTETFVQYFIGWQCNISGKRYQQKLAIK